MTERRKREPDSAEVEELELDATDSSPLDAAIRDAVAAVEEVEKKQVGKKPKAKEPKAKAPSDSGSIDVDLQESTGAKEELERLRKEVASLKDTSLRTLADFDNYRKRAEREKEESRRYALLEPMRDFVAVVDNLDRALAAEGRAEDLKTGVDLIRRQMHVVLERNHVTIVPALGERFDPMVHEAVMQEESADVDEPTVRQEFQRGYCLHDRLIRPAMVKVAMPAAKLPEDGDEA